MNELALATVLAVIGSTGDVRSVAVDGEVTWVGTTTGLLVLVPGEPRQGVRGPALGTVHTLRVDGDAVLAGTDHGPVRCAASRGRGFACTPAPAAGLPAELTHVRGVGETADGLYVATTSRGAFYVRNGRVRSLRGDRLCFSVATEGRDAWIGCADGLHHFRNGRRVHDAPSRASSELPIADVRAVVVRNGAPVVGTAGAGLFEWTGSRWRAVPGQPSWLAHARVNALALSGDGALVAGTTGGLARETGDTFTRELGDDLPDEDLTSLARTREGLWVGTFQHGLALVHDDGRVERFDEARGLVDDRINRLAVDADGDLWIATDRGVMERERGRFVMRGLLGEHVFMVASAGDRIWAAAGSSLVVRAGAGWSEIATLAGRRPQDATTHAGRVHVGTAEGLARESGRAFALTQSERDGLVDDWITAVTDYRGRLVAGTYNAGLTYADAISTERIRDDLWVNAGALAVAGDLLAVGTLDQGLWLFDGEEWRILTTADGLPDDDVTAILPLADGSMWIATRGGLAYVGTPRSFVAPSRPSLARDGREPDVLAVLDPGDAEARARPGHVGIVASYR